MTMNASSHSSAIRSVYAACSRVFSSRWRTTDAGHWSDLGLESLEALQSTDRHTTNVFFCVLLVPLRTCVIFYQRGTARWHRQRVCELCHLWPLYTLSTQLGSETL